MFDMLLPFKGDYTMLVTRRRESVNPFKGIWLKLWIIDMIATTLVFCGVVGLAFGLCKLYMVIYS